MSFLPRSTSTHQPSGQNGGLLRELETRFGGLVCHQDTINAVAYSPDGRRLASASSDGTIKLWDPSAGKQVKRQQFVLPDVVDQTTFSHMFALLLAPFFTTIIHAITAEFIASRRSQTFFSYSPKSNFGSPFLIAPPQILFPLFPHPSHCQLSSFLAPLQCNVALSPPLMPLPLLRFRGREQLTRVLTISLLREGPTPHRAPRGITCVGRGMER